MRMILTGMMLLLAAPAAAVSVPYVSNGAQSIVGFDDVALGTTAFQTGAIPTNISGGGVVAGTPSNPALSGEQVYGGTSIVVTVGPALNDLNDYVWPDFGAYVTGTADVLLELSTYDPDAQIETVVLTASVGPGTHLYLSGGSTDFAYGLYTSAHFSSDAYFTMDMLQLGLPNVAPGIPEPATWALLIAGFGLTGTALRRRREAIA